MADTICLDKNYSTTRLTTKEKPEIVKNDEDELESVLFLPEGEERKGEGGLRTKGYFKFSYENLMMNDEYLILNDKKGNQYKLNDLKFKIQNSKLNKLPLISIVTVVYNGEQFLEETILSVINQTYDNIEYIIIDGGSTDGTVDIIKEYEDKIDYWVSEKDAGIADAWNKGVSLCVGSIIGILNADDIYDRYSCAKVVSEFLIENNHRVLYYGECRFIDDGEIIGVNNSKFDSKNLLRGFGFTHTTCFLTKTVYKKLGLFNIDYKVALDSEFLLRCYLANIEFKQLTNITYMSIGGISDTQSKKGYFEYLNVLDKYCIFSKLQTNKMRFIYTLYHPVRNILKNRRIKLIARKIKHLIIRIMNFIYQILPGFYLKNKFLKSLDISIGKSSYIHKNSIFYTVGNLEIKDNSVINHSCVLDNRKKISIGKNVSIAHNTRIYTCGHDIDSPYFDIKCKEVVIDDYVVTFANVIIMPGVNLAKGSVILPGTIVTKSTEEYGVYGGNPAKLLRYRSKLLSYKIDYGFWYAL